MLATIRVSPYVFIQGVVTRRLSNGHVAIRLGASEYVGQPLDTGERPRLAAAS